jgi:hypothetical protein
MAIVAPGKGAVHVRAAWDLGLLLGHPGGAARAFARGWACLSNPMCKLFLKGIQIQRLTEKSFSPPQAAGFYPKR